MTTLPPLYRIEELRRLEADARRANPQPSLMARAGLAAAEWARELLGQNGRNVLVLAGPGDNGGDALELAAHLKNGFFRVDVVRPAESRTPGTDARIALEKWNAADGRLLNAIPAAVHYDLVVDGLFGIGLARPVDGIMARLIEQANAVRAPRLALDIPSGLDADTGTRMGNVFHATHTLTFIAGKPGLYTLEGPDACGVVRIADLGVAPADEASGFLMTQDLLDALPLRRPRNFHKGDAGSFAVLGGASGMVGAAILAARAALKLGAGKAYAGLLTDHPPGLDGVQPELMLRRPEALLNDTSLAAIAAGPGMGTDSLAQRVLTQALRCDVPIVLDADALNLIASYTVLQSAVQSREAPTLMTPHPAEAARLLGRATADVQADRITTALELARRFRCVVVLKGNGSVCANAAGRWWVNTTGNPGMASAGMGDVLNGFIGALLAQGVDAEQALLAAVYLHGAAGDQLVARGIGPIGLTAHELIDAARELLNRALAGD